MLSLFKKRYLYAYSAMCYVDCVPTEIFDGLYESKKPIKDGATYDELKASIRERATKHYPSSVIAITSICKLD